MKRKLVQLKCWSFRVSRVPKSKHQYLLEEVATWRDGSMPHNSGEHIILHRCAKRECRAGDGYLGGFSVETFLRKKRSKKENHSKAYD